MKTTRLSDFLKFVQYLLCVCKSYDKKKNLLHIFLQLRFKTKNVHAR